MIETNAANLAAVKMSWTFIESVVDMQLMIVRRAENEVKKNGLNANWVLRKELIIYSDKRQPINEPHPPVDHIQERMV